MKITEFTFAYTEFKGKKIQHITVSASNYHKARKLAERQLKAQNIEPLTGLILLREPPLYSKTQWDSMAKGYDKARGKL